MDDASYARAIADRRSAVRERLAEIETRLAEVRRGRAEWTDEEHDPEGFTLTHEWSRIEGDRLRLGGELLELDRAESRLADGDFGRCRSCGELIPLEQIARQPTRTECVACARRGER